MKLKNIRIFALAACLLSTTAQSADLTVHEWGTFTSFQGSDGKLLAWQPLLTSHLPDFVHGLSKPGTDTQIVNLAGIGGKFSLMALQRLETPVVYFYTDGPQTVDLTVKFPKGLITEWYPRADTISRSQTDGQIQWSNLQVFSGGTTSHPATPNEPYFAARATDSDCVKSQDETEKFLFYRGAGNLGTPLRVTMKSDFSVTLSNAGNENIPHLFVFQIDNGVGGFQAIPGLKPGEERTIVAPRLQKRATGAFDELATQIENGMAKALVQSGLYPREAQAMVNTWKDSWFKENGLRVMYILPRPWTDRALPLAINPTPAKMVRVMVGRAEVLRPGLEQTLVSDLSGASRGDQSAIARARDTLKGLGRFAEPALSHVFAAAKNLPADEQSRLFSLLASKPVFE